MQDEDSERAELIIQILDKIKPIPANAPPDVQDAIDAERQFLAMRADWISMPLNKLRHIAQQQG